MPRCIECDLGGREQCDHIREPGAFTSNDVDFATNNRLFCDFLHRGIVPDEGRQAPEEGEGAVQWPPRRPRACGATMTETVHS
jgi:hypothetical protein